MYGHKEAIGDYGSNYTIILSHTMCSLEGLLTIPNKAQCLGKVLKKLSSEEAKLALTMKLHRKPQIGLSVDGTMYSRTAANGKREKDGENKLDNYMTITLSILASSFYILQSDHSSEGSRR